jgi:hypothetical protein
MGKDATINMTQLKAATGILSNRLTAHDPSGPGVRESFGAFLADEIEGVKQGSDSMWQNLCKSWEVRGNREQGSYDSNDLWVYQNNITINKEDSFSFVINVVQTFVNGSRDGEHVVEQIMSRTEHWTISTNNASVDNIRQLQNPSDTDDYDMEVECTLTDRGNKTEIFMDYDAPLNTDMANATARFAFRTAEIEQPLEVSTSLTASNIYSDEIRLSYDITDGTPNYDYTIERKPAAAPDSNYSQITSGTHTQDVTNETYSDTDEDLTVGNEYKYRITVDDDAGDSDTAEAGPIEHTG